MILLRLRRSALQDRLVAGIPEVVNLDFFFSSRRRHTRFDCDWSSDVCSSDLPTNQNCSTKCGTSSAANIIVFAPSRLTSTGSSASLSTTANGTLQKWPKKKSPNLDRKSVV